MGFASDMRRVQLRLSQRRREVFVGCVEETTRSIVEGSDLTGSPGQPVDTGRLKASWQTVFESPTHAVIGTNVEYARSIEDGISYAHGGTPITIRSKVGGTHSVQRTTLNFDRIVARRRRADGT
jgi:phage gpG-like protein